MCMPCFMVILPLEHNHPWLYHWNGLAIICESFIPAKKWGCNHTARKRHFFLPFPCSFPYSPVGGVIAKNLLYTQYKGFLFQFHHIVISLLFLSLTLGDKCRFLPYCTKRNSQSVANRVDLLKEEEALLSCKYALLGHVCVQWLVARLVHVCVHMACEACACACTRDGHLTKMKCCFVISLRNESICYVTKQ